MLSCFLDEETYNKVQGFVTGAFKINRETYPVYELLCRINSKDVDVAVEDERPSFSGEKKVGCRNTIKVLRDNGVHDGLIQEKIIEEGNINNVINFIKGTGLFKNVSKSSVEAFRENYQPEVGAVEAEPPHHHVENPEEDDE